MRSLSFSCLSRALPVHRHLDCDQQLALVERFEDVSKRRAALGALDRCAVGMGCQKNHRNVLPVADGVSRGDPVALPLQPDVHQYQVGLLIDGALDGEVRGINRGDDDHAEPYESLLKFLGNQCLVFDHQNTETDRTDSRRPLSRIAFCAARRALSTGKVLDHGASDIDATLMIVRPFNERPRVVTNSGGLVGMDAKGHRHAPAR